MPTKSISGRAALIVSMTAVIQLGVFQVSVVIASEPPAGEVILSVSRCLGNRRLIAAEHEVGISAIGGCRKQGRREIGALQVLA